MPTHAHTIRWLCALVALAASAGACAAADTGRDDVFPMDASLRPAVAFWTRVYIEVDTRAGFIHDARHLGVVYETVRLKRPDSQRHRARQTKARKAHWRGVLTRLAGGGAPRNGAERRVVEALTVSLGRAPRAGDLRAAMSRIRFQLGQRDKFEAGLVRAGAYEDEIRRIFRSFGLPEDLGYLPHVESSFNIGAWSKYGAAGMWQFMPGTGRRFMTVDYVLDERLDPLEASVAAAKLLRYNKSVLGSWPLALTAYNHGVAGMRRAVKKVGTDDIARIVEAYKGRAFGFASRNFYAQFLAARAVARNAAQHFGDLERRPPARPQAVDLPFYVDVEHVERYLRLDAKTLRRYNPALRPSVYEAHKRIPKGYALKLPPGTISGDPGRWLARVPAEHRHAEQRLSGYHVVRRGDTLSGIAKLHRTRVSTIVALNGLQSRHRIWPGQRLELLAPRAGVTLAATPEPEPAPVSTAPVSTALSTPVPVSVPRSGLVANPFVIANVRPVSVPGEIPSLGVRLQTVEGEEIRVGAGETIGHFAGWLSVSSRDLRRLNSLSPRRSIRMGQRLLVDFTRVSREEFVRKRVAHHLAIETAFLERHRIAGVHQHALRSGENLWVLATKVYDVPDWLIHRYNPDTLEGRLAPGTQITIPVVEILSES